MYRDPLEAERARAATLEEELAEARALLAKERARHAARGEASEHVAPEVREEKGKRPLGWLLAALVWTGLMVMVGAGVSWTGAHSQSWPAVVRPGTVTQATPDSPVKVGEACAVTIETAESAGEHYSKTRNCHVRLECAQRSQYSGFFPCLVIDDVPLIGSDTMVSSVDTDPALSFDLGSNDLTLRDDGFRAHITLTGAFPAHAEDVAANPPVAAPASGVATLEGDAGARQLLDVNDCWSGQMLSFSGVDLFHDPALDRRLRIVDTPVDGKQVVLLGLVAGHDRILVDPKVCAKFQVDVQPSNTSLNDITALRGSVSLDCSLPDPLGHLSASIELRKCWFDNRARNP